MKAQLTWPLLTGCAAVAVAVVAHALPSTSVAGAHAGGESVVDVQASLRLEAARAAFTPQARSMTLNPRPNIVSASSLADVNLLPAAYTAPSSVHSTTWLAADSSTALSRQEFVADAVDPVAPERRAIASARFRF